MQDLRFPHHSKELRRALHPEKASISENFFCMLKKMLDMLSIHHNLNAQQDVGYVIHKSQFEC